MTEDGPTTRSTGPLARMRSRRVNVSVRHIETERQKGGHKRTFALEHGPCNRKLQLDFKVIRKGARSRTARRPFI